MSGPQQTQVTRTSASRAAHGDGVFAPGDVVDRFSIVAEIGRGGMGRIYEAEDPNLQRRVALKLLLGHGVDLHRQRLIREAQALGRLEHPNVITVHEVGSHEGLLFIAMELVKGGTLKDWLKENPPGPQARQTEAIRLLAESGRGVLAAHAQGLIHRDIKPSNILIGMDGRPRVADFGIVRSLRLARSGQEHAVLQGEERGTLVDSNSGTLTRSGASVGTPAYMAPEQFGGGETGEAADLFSFCVTAWEVLFGERPHRGRTVHELLDSIQSGRPVMQDAGLVPDGLTALLRKGLKYRPGERPRSLKIVVDELDVFARTGKQSSTARRRWWVGGAIALTAAATTAGMSGALEDAACTASSERLQGIWDEERRVVVGKSLRETAVAYADDTANRVVENIQDYTDAWVDAHRTVCEATWVRGEQSETSLDARMRCLDRRRGELRALVGVLADADGEVVERGVSAVAALSSPGACVTADPVAASRLPEDSKERQAVLGAQARTDDAQAQLRAGRYPVAEDVAREAMTLAAATNHGPTIARTLYVQGRVAEKLGEHAAAVDRYRDAALGAARIGDPALETRALVAYVSLAGVHMHDPDRARGIAVGAKSALLRAGTPPDLESQLAQALGASALASREIRESIGYLEQGWEAAKRAYPPGDLRFAEIQANLGNALSERGDLMAAEELLRRALKLGESKLGPMHPRVAVLAQNLANVLLASKPAGLSEAIELTDRAMVINRASLGPEAKAVADLWAIKARLHKKAGQHERALAEYARAADIYRQVGADLDLGDILTNLINLHLANGAFEDAQRDALEALPLFEGSSYRAIRGRARATLRLCIATRNLDPALLAAGSSPVEHCRDAVERVAKADLTAPEIYRSIRELALALETHGELADARRTAADALAAAPKKREKEAIELLARLRRLGRRQNSARGR